MAKDYYKILDLTREATTLDICKAYKRKALVWHPKITKADSVTAYHNFCEISEAYEVLSSNEKRAFFDKHGEVSLKEGFFSDGELKGGYYFKGNPEEIFESFFGTNNIYSALLEKDADNMGSLLGYSFGAQNYTRVKKPEELLVDVPCNLTELYCGCSKVVSFHKTILNRDGITTSVKECSKELEIRAGMADKQQIVFEKEGNEGVGVHSSNLVFRIVQTVHPLYRRKGDDLIYVAHITLLSSLMCEPLTVQTLDGRSLPVSISEIVNQDSVRKVDGEGMKKGDSAGRGDLYITFKIEFPKALTENQRRTLYEALK
jgi:DnaJ family protein B protein 13